MAAMDKGMMGCTKLPLITLLHPQPSIRGVTQTSRGLGIPEVRVGGRCTETGPEAKWRNQCLTWKGPAHLQSGQQPGNQPYL